MQPGLTARLKSFFLLFAKRIQQVCEKPHVHTMDRIETILVDSVRLPLI